MEKKEKSGGQDPSLVNPSMQADNVPSPADMDTAAPTGADMGVPRAREVVEGREATVPGFTNTSPSGSQGGRATYGMASPDVTWEELGRRSEKEEEDAG